MMSKVSYISLVLMMLSILIILSSCNADQTRETENIFYDDDNMLVINGKRTFMIGSYHHPKVENPFQELSSNGYNYVHVSPAEAELDSASKYNLLAWITTGVVNDKDKSDTARIAELANEFRDHPALLFWEIADEPAFNWNNPEPRITSEKMLEAYTLIKSHDRKHQVFTNHGPVNLISTLQKYNSSTDLVAVDVYPVIPHGIKPTYALYPDGLQGDLLNPYISQVGEYVDKMKMVVNNTKPVFAVLQGFSWEMLKEEADRNPAMILYPTYEEFRFMAYNAIVHGANGIVIWGTNYTPQPSPFIDDLNKVTRELASIQEVISSKNVKNNVELIYHELGYSVDAGVEMIFKKSSDKYYLITTNSDKKPVKVTFSGLSDFSRVSVLSENREHKILKGEFTDSYNPFDAHIYELE